MSDKQYTHHDDQTHLEAALRRSKPWFEANATFLIYGLAAVLAVAAAIVWMQRQPEANSEVSALLMEARNPEEFQSIADKFSGTELGELARLKQAEALLNSATGKMFKDRTAAALELEQADAALNRLGDGNSADPTFNERVLIGKARLAELRCDGTEESVKAVVAGWQQILDQNDAAIAKEMIERRIARLQRPEAGEFYAWFHGLEPQSADDLMIPGLPGGSFGPGAGAGPGSNVPDVPLNFDFPALPAMNDEESSEEPATEEPATEEPATEEPATEEPATEEPATEEPATEEPATEEPATEEPATEEPATEEPATEEPASEESTESESEADAGE